MDWQLIGFMTKEVRRGQLYTLKLPLIALSESAFPSKKTLVREGR